MDSNGAATQAGHQGFGELDVKSSGSSTPLDAEVLRFLRLQLGAGDGNRRFAEAVVAHLGTGPTRIWSQMEAARRVVELMRPMYNTDARAILLRYPELMASVFQNADLLDPTEPGSNSLSRMVMKAMEDLHERKE